jgi:hypothetical protein
VKVQVCDAAGEQGKQRDIQDDERNERSKCGERQGDDVGDPAAGLTASRQEVDEQMATVHRPYGEEVRQPPNHPHLEPHLGRAASDPGTFAAKLPCEPADQRAGQRAGDEDGDPAQAAQSMDALVGGGSSEPDQVDGGPEPEDLLGGGVTKLMSEHHEERHDAPHDGSDQAVGQRAEQRGEDEEVGVDADGQPAQTELKRRPLRAEGQRVHFEGVVTPDPGLETLPTPARRRLSPVTGCA